MVPKLAVPQLGAPSKRLGYRTFRSYADIHPLWVAALVTAALLAAWAACVSAGGSRTPLPHLFYVPIMLATVRFGFRGAMSPPLPRASSPARCFPWTPPLGLRSRLAVG